MLQDQKEDWQRYGSASHAAEKQQGDESPVTHFAPGYPVDEETYRTVCHAPKDKDHADLCQQWRVAEYARIQSWINAAGLIFLIGTFVFTAIAAGAARRAANFTGKAAAHAEDAAGAANESAKSDREANELMRDHAELELRAYVLIDSITTVESAENTIRVKIRNYGQTPAYSVVKWVWSDIDVFPREKPFTQPRDSSLKSAATMGPGQMDTFNIDPRSPNNQEADAISKGDSAIYAYGVISYRDAFKRERFTNYRFVCRGDDFDTGRFIPTADDNESN